MDDDTRAGPATSSSASGGFAQRVYTESSSLHQISTLLSVRRNWSDRWGDWVFSLDAHGVCVDREPSSLVIPTLERFEEQGIPWLICSYAVQEDTKRRVRDCLARLLGRLDFFHPQPAGRQYRVPLLFTATKTKRGTGKPDWRSCSVSEASELSTSTTLRIFIWPFILVWRAGTGG